MARRHQRRVYGALLREAAATVQLAAENRDWIGGRPGILAVLHTWSRTLDYHPHVHLLVTAGGLTPDGVWVRLAHRRFLMPGYLLSHVFRAKMRDSLARAGLVTDRTDRVWRRRWTVHVAQVGSGAHAALYLSRYIYRVAITNERLVRYGQGRVTFRYTHARTRTTRALTLPVATFLTRFLDHVLPRGFTKVRWYGLLSASHRTDLARARQLLERQSAAPPAPAAPSTTPPADSEPPITPAPRADRCPVCRSGHLVLVAHYPAPRAPPAAIACTRAA